MATVDEIAPDIFRINLGAMPGDPITTSFFLIRDEQPTLVETGYRKTFDHAWEAVSRLLDPPRCAMWSYRTLKATRAARSTISWSGHRTRRLSAARSGPR